jgi:hypothetical protein
MNERLQELARQAGFFANPDVEKFEKFAELIVRECSRIALSDEVAHMNPQSTAENISKEILKIIE